MKQGMKRRPIVVGVALLTIVLILGFVLYVASYPQSFPTYGYGISSSVYRMTGGL
ncbi:hypothetical protein [Thermoplasma sp.]|uniref:hypothetical protein n=1 Tax=Thermoplasma sp. TaxID=1973142 RepID=UPI0025E22231|nr:hypothetical protein [Thermoplasma sp.]